MDRQMIYPGQIPLETDLLNTNRNVLVALGKLAGAIIGTTTTASGLLCTQTGTPSLGVQVGPGELYSLQNLDASAYSSLAADTTHQVVKQGILLDAVTLSCPAPVTAGFSVVYLVQATYQDVDAAAVTLPYYNASNPTQAYTGPNNSGAAQSTVRQGTVVLSAKAGVAASTGSQIAPTADSGYVGLWVVTVANGATTVTNTNIAKASGAPFIGGFTPLTGLGATGTWSISITGAAAGVPWSGVTGKPTTVGGYGITDALTQVTADASYLALTGGNLSGNLSILGTSGTRVLGLTNTTSAAGLKYVRMQLDASGNIFVGGLDDTQATFTRGLRVQPTGALVDMSTGLPLVTAAAFTANQSLSANGYCKIPGGLILQWGSVAVGADTTAAVTFPIAFPSACIHVSGSGQSNLISAGSNQTGISFTGTSASGTTVCNDTTAQNVFYFAMGY